MYGIKISAIGRFRKIKHFASIKQLHWRISGDYKSIKYELGIALNMFQYTINLTFVFESIKFTFVFDSFILHAFFSKGKNGCHR